MGCANFAKYGLFFINIITCIGGLIVLALGIWTVADRLYVNEILGTNLYAGAAYVLIITGALISLISCFGCFGAAKEVRCMLVTYFIAVFLIFVTMLVGGILGYVFREKVDITLENEMVGSLRFYGNGNYGPVTRAWDDLQRRLECCGVHGPEDWQGEVPNSCCRQILGRWQSCNSLVEQQNSFTMYQRGCYRVARDFVKQQAAILGAAGIIVACIMILGMIFACVLFKVIE